MDKDDKIDNTISRIFAGLFVLGAIGYTLIAVQVPEGPWNWTAILGIVLAAPFAFVLVAMLVFFLVDFLYWIATGKRLIKQ